MTYKITKTPIPKLIITNKNIGWVNIPKNASTPTVNLFRTMGSKYEIYENQKPEILFCVWQNPVTRLVSSLGEYKRRKKDSRSIVKLLTAFEHNPVPFDEHLEPQTYYVEHLLHRRFDYVFRFENFYNELLSANLFDRTLVKEHIQPDVKSKTPDFDIILREHDETIQRIVNKWYKRDLEIYNDLSQITK